MVNLSTEYDSFLNQKRKSVGISGFDYLVTDMNPLMFDFQKYLLAKALKTGKYAIFADCGLGKTFMQLEWANIVSKRTGKPVLILAPLSVSSQTIREGDKFGIAVQSYA